MLKTCRAMLKDIMPPLVVRLLRLPEGVRCQGRYASWEEARAASDGYDADDIFEKTKQAMRDLLAGRGVFERDSVLFDAPEYEWPLLSGLMWGAAANGGDLNVLDFGGSLGSTYHQYRRFLQSLSLVRWNIVEQRHMVKAGREEFSTDQLHFYPDIVSCLAETSPQLLLLSSVVHYLPDPHAFLEQAAGLGFAHVLVDRTPFLLQGDDLLTVQHVPPSIYSASYPCWFFNRERFFGHFTPDYEVVATFPALDKANVPSSFEGAILTRRAAAH